MANFDLDDPLADLLSDGSNDSFFEEPKASVKKLSLTKTPEKKSVSELFGIDKSEAKPANTNTNWLGILKDKKEPEKIQSHSPKKLIKKISFENDNIMSNLEVKPSKQDTTTDTSKKVSLTDSIFKPTSSEKSISSSDVSKFNTLPKKPDMNIETQDKLIKKSEEMPSKHQPVLDSHREGRRPHQVQSGFTDFLGILSNEPFRNTENDTKLTSPVKKPELKSNPKNIKRNMNSPQTDIVQTEVLFPAPGNRDMKAKSAPNIGLLPNWLDGGGSSQDHKLDANLPMQVESEGGIISSKEDVSVVTLPQQDTPILDKQPSDNYLLQSLMTQQKLAACESEYQNANIVMQQQNSQLALALQLKKYEDNLIIMQRKQQEVLSKQEKQFNWLLERQLTKQQIIENNMRMQQEKINSHMQMLLTQSHVDDSLAQEDFDNIQDLKKSTANENTRLLEELLNSFKQKSQEEKSLLEESYKKQISTLEQTMESIENRLKAEIDHLHETYHVKYNQLGEDYEKEIKKYKEKIDEMSIQQANEIRSIRESHDKVIEEIKYEYTTLIESIKQTKQSETSLFQNSSEYSQKLDSSIKVLDMNTRLLIGVRDKVESDYGILTAAREESLKGKEEEIKLMRNSLEKVRASAENERSQLLALIRSLEIKLTEQTQNAREERWTMQQAASTLAARAAALDREAEFSRAALEREREQLKTLKESLLAEQENKTLQLTEEKLALSAERARLETSTKLFQNYDSQRSKAEIDAAIEVAKKAAEMTDTERKNLHQLQCEVETLKRTLLDREHKLVIKERELETMMQIAERKSKDGEQAIVQANATQRDYNERLKDIQNQLVSLSSRERKLAEEKINLSKERLSLQGQIRQLKHPSSYIFELNPQIEDYDYPESV